MQNRQEALNSAFLAHPERFVHGAPVASEVPNTVWINPPSPISKSPVVLAPVALPQESEPDERTRRDEQPRGAVDSISSTVVQKGGADSTKLIVQ
jgi:hypothetical protein